MAYGLVLATTADAYTARNTVQGAEVVRVGIMVANASIIYQLQAVAATGSALSSLGAWLPEQGIYCAAGLTAYLSLERRCTGFRVRSAIAGQAAVVNVELIGPYELPDDG